MAGNNEDLIQSLRTQERAVSQLLKQAISDMDAVRKRANDLRKQLSDLETERLLLERQITKVKKLPPPAEARQQQQRSAATFGREAFKSMFSALTAKEREDFLKELTS